MCVFTSQPAAAHTFDADVRCRVRIQPAHTHTHRGKRPYVREKQSTYKWHSNASSKSVRVDNAQIGSAMKTTDNSVYPEVSTKIVADETRNAIFFSPTKKVNLGPESVADQGLLDADNSKLYKKWRQRRREKCENKIPNIRRATKHGSFVRVPAPGADRNLCLLHIINLDECFRIVFGLFAGSIRPLVRRDFQGNPIFCLINLPVFTRNDNWNYAKQTQTDSFGRPFHPFSVFASSARRLGGHKLLAKLVDLLFFPRCIRMGNIRTP